MDTDTLRSALEQTGLTQYEADAYITLVELGSATAVEIAEGSDVPQSRIYDVVRELESEGYVETYEEGTLRARANDPDELIETINAQATLMTDAAVEIESRWEEPPAEDHTVSVVKRFQTVLDHARDRIENAKYEVEIVVTLNQFESLREELAAAYDRGVIVKVAIARAPGSSEIEDTDTLFEGVATEVRVRQLPTAFLVLTDRTEVCFAPTARLPRNEQYGILIEDYTLSQMFDYYYQTAVWEAWDAIYTTRTDEWPKTYTDIRNCLNDVAPLVEAGDTVYASVKGTFRVSGEDADLVGRITDVSYVRDDSTPTLASFVEAANLVLETDNRSYEIGGRGALLEDVEAYRIDIEGIDRSP